MVSAGDVCRLCLAMDARLHVIAGTPLQDIYEKLTEISLNTPCRSVVACHLCYCRLRKCHDMMVRSVRADKVLTQILQGDNIAEQEFVAIIKQYHLNDGLCVTPTVLIAITNTEDGLIEEAIKKELQLTQFKGAVRTELIKFEESEDEDERDTQMGESMNMEDIDSQEFINEGDAKTEVFEEPLNVEGQELTGEDIKLEAFEEVQDIATERLIDELGTAQEQLKVIQHNETEGADPSNNCEETQDGCTLTPHEKNILERRKRRAVLKETSITSIGGNKTQVLKNVSMYVDATINKDNSSVNSDNDCTSTETDVDNSGREHLKKVVISDECGDVSDDKYLLVEHHNVTRTSNLTNGEGRSHRNTLLRKQRCGRTGIVNKHTDKSRGKKLFECDVCQRRFTSKGNLNIHIKTHTSEKKRKHNGEKPFECHICRAKFTQKYSLKIHFRIHTGKKPFECHICQAKFTQKHSLKIHLRTHTGEKPFECDICRAKFTNKYHLNKHIRTHTGEKPFECKICKRKFSQKYTLKIHLMLHTGEKPYECEICKDKFCQKSDLNVHFRTHTGEKPFECEICKLKFNQQSTLKKHLRTHTGEKPFECKICKRKFSQKYTLKTHLRLHTGEKPFECEICKVKFSEKSNLNVHLRTHTGQKAFECEICRAKFTKKSNLNIHFRAHIGEKPYECEICKDKFSRKSYLNVHFRTHTGEKPFECEICKDKFSQKSHLNRHFRTHTGKRVFECEICQVNFYKNAALTRHLTTHAIMD